MHHYEVVSNLHDAEVIGVGIAGAGSSLRVDLLRASGTPVSIEARGVVTFRAVDMAKQNVVSRVCISTIETDIGWIRDRLNWATERVDSSSYLSEQASAEYARRVSSGELKLLWIEPSAGVELVALCEHVEVS
jgi:hypothetical protein